MNNMRIYGLRFAYALSGAPGPLFEPWFVDSAESFDVNGGLSNAKLRAGDVVRYKATGGIEQCDGPEGAGGAEKPYGVVAHIDQYYDGSMIVRKKSMPSDLTYSGTERQGRLAVIPARSAVFEADCNDNDQATTLAAYQALIGSNVDVRLYGASGEEYLNPMIDIGTTNTINTLVWRVVGVSPTLMNQDFSGDYVKLLIKANLIQEPYDSATGV